MREGVQDALNEATESLAAEGFDSAEEVKERIMQKKPCHCRVSGKSKND